MNKYVFSIIICAYNESENIFNCIRSLKETLTFSKIGKDELEIIVIDNSSIDNTWAEINRAFTLFGDYYKTSKIIINHVPLAISRNTGLSISKGEYVIFVDADALIDLNWFTALRENIDKNKSKVVFSGKVSNLAKSKKDFSNFYHRMIIGPSQISDGSKLIGANMAFKRKALVRCRRLF